MDQFALTADQLALKDMAQRFAAEKLAPGALEWDESKELPVDILREAGALGMGGIYVKDDVGGSGLTRLDAALILESLSTADPSVAAFVSIHNMVAWMIDRFGNEAQRAKYLPHLCTMEHLGSYCLTEASAGSDAAALKSRARREGDSYILNGAKQFISGAGTSNVYVVMARTGAEGPSGISCFVVEKDTPGLSFGKNERKLGWAAQSTRTVNFDDMRIPAGNLIGKEGDGFKIAMMGLDGGRLNIAACSLGGAQAALDKTIAYMRERNAFGNPLSKFQALQFRVADMATELAAARLMLYSAAAEYDRGARDTLVRCAMAKRFVTDVAFNVANEALQLHGGYGYLSEYGIEKIMRDLRAHQIIEGTNEIMRVVIARNLLGN